MKMTRQLPQKKRRKALLAALSRGALGEVMFSNGTASWPSSCDMLFSPSFDLLTVL